MASMDILTETSQNRGAIIICSPNNMFFFQYNIQLELVVVKYPSISSTFPIYNLLHVIANSYMKNIKNSISTKNLVKSFSIINIFHNYMEINS